LLSAAQLGRVKDPVTGGKPVCKRREARKLLRRQDRVRLQNHRHVNIIDFTGFSYARDVYEPRLSEDALLTRSAAGTLYPIDQQKDYGVNDVRFSAKNSSTKRALNFCILLQYLQVYDVYDVNGNRSPTEAKLRDCEHHVYGNGHSQRRLLTRAAHG
jgi:hypothetical protein